MPFTVAKSRGSTFGLKGCIVLGFWGARFMSVAGQVMEIVQPAEFRAFILEHSLIQRTLHLEFFYLYSIF